VATTEILHALAYEESYGKRGRARAAYAALGPGETVSACRDCGACEKACPYGVAVRSRIREAGRLLA